MSRNARSAVHGRVVPDAVLSALAQKYATMVGQVSLQLPSRDHAHPATASGPLTTTMAVMTSTLTWTAVFDTVDNGWVQGRIAELPGVITAAPTLDEAKAGLVDALHEYLASLAEPQHASHATPSTILESLELVIRS